MFSNLVKGFVESIGSMSILFMQTIYWTIHNLKTGRFSVRNLLDQMSRIGVDSLLMVAITGVSTGAVLVVQIGYQFAQMRTKLCGWRCQSGYGA